MKRKGPNKKNEEEHFYFISPVKMKTRKNQKGMTMSPSALADPKVCRCRKHERTHPLLYPTQS